MTRAASPSSCLPNNRSRSANSSSVTARFELMRMRTSQPKARRFPAAQPSRTRPVQTAESTPSEARSRFNRAPTRTTRRIASATPSSSAEPRLRRPNRVRRTVQLPRRPARKLRVPPPNCGLGRRRLVSNRRRTPIRSARSLDSNRRPTVRESISPSDRLLIDTQELFVDLESLTSHP